MTSEEIRETFPGTRRQVYLNAAAASLLPTPVSEAVARTLERQVERGILAWPEDVATVKAAREALARRIGARPADVAFVQNTAEAVARVAAGIDWRAGDEVVLGDLEFPANVLPWAAWHDRGARLRVVGSEDGRLPAGRLLDALGPRSRVLAVSWVQFGSGYRTELEPLARACRERGILFLVDAIQGLGVLPLDVSALGAAAVVGEGRKWLMAPAGTGFLWLDPDWAEAIVPRAPGAIATRDVADPLAWRAGRRGSRIDLDAVLRPGAGRFESGIPNFLGLAGLTAALELGEAIGSERIERSVARLVARLVEGVELRGWRVHGPRRAEERAGIVAFDHPAPPEAVFRRLNADGISIAVRDGRLRAAPHVYNTEAEIDRLLDRLDALAAEEGGR